MLKFWSAMALLDDGHWVPVRVKEEATDGFPLLGIEMAERFGPQWLERERDRKLCGAGIVSLEHTSGGFMGCGG
jgi:hypothetical protein